MMETNEENIRKSTNQYRWNMTVVICLLLVILIVTPSLIIIKYLPGIKEYSLGMFSAYVGLIARSTVFRNCVDPENGMLFEFDKQKKLIRMTYEKHLIIVLAYSMILVFLIKVLVLCNCCGLNPPSVGPAIIGANIVMGFHTDLKILNILSK